MRTNVSRNVFIFLFSVFGEYKPQKSENYLKLGMFLCKIKFQRYKLLKIGMKLLNIFLLNELAREI